MTVIAFQALNITIFGIIAVLLDVELGTFSLFMQFKCVCIRALIESFFGARKSPLPRQVRSCPYATKNSITGLCSVKGTDTEKKTF